MSKLDFLLNTTTIDCNNLEWFYAAQTNPAYSIIRLCAWRLHVKVAEVQHQNSIIQQP